MKSIDFDNGLRKIAINGDENNYIEIDTSDALVIERLYRCINNIERITRQQPDITLKADGAPYENMEECVKAVQKIDSYIRDQVDMVLGSGASQKIFGSLSTMRMVGGMQLWERVLIKLAPIVKDEILKQQKLRNKRLAKYLKK